MNYLDFALLIPVLWGMYKGFKNGFISEVGAIIALILGIWLASLFSAQGAEFLAAHTEITPQYREITAFALIFFIVVVLCFIITQVLKRFFDALHLTWLDKLLGIVFGACKWLIITAFIFFFTQVLIARYYKEPVGVLEKSLFFKPLAEAVHNVLEHNVQLPPTGLSPSIETQQH